MIKYLGHIEKKVDDKIRLAKNKLKQWKYGYDSEHDIILISKDGTLGEIYYIQGISIGFPEAPTERKEIFNWDKTDKNQRWKRNELPKGLTKSTQYQPEYESYIKEEFRRRDEGLWIFIKGHKVYLPGSYYFFCQWNRLDEGYPNFRIIQNELMIYWEACKADNRCYGIDFVKPRRYGWTSLCNSELIESGTTHENKDLGIISKTGEDARKMFQRLVRTFKKLPSFFMPVWDGTTTPKKELLLSEPSRKKTIDDSDKVLDEGLDTLIRYHSTVINAMDGDKIFRSAIDECGKFPKDCPFDEYWRIVKTSHRQGKRIVGKAMVGSTVNSKKKGGAEFEKVYNQSDPTKRNKNGQTISGLYRLFIDTVFCWEGFFDTYGFSIVEDLKTAILTDLGEYTKIGAVTHWNNEFEALKDDQEAANEFLRQNPRNIKHAFRDESDDCAFNLNKILEQIEHNAFESNHNEIGSDEIERGNLQWKDGVLDSEVIWKPNPEGRWWLKKGCHPPKEYRNKKENKWINGVLAWSPIATHLGCLGADPYNRTRTADGKGSLGSISLETKMNTSYLPNNTFILEYIDRASKVEYYFEDVLMTCVYFSMQVLGELSNEAFLKHIKNRGYRHFSMNNPFKLWKELSYTEKELGGAPPQNSKIADQQFYAIEAHIDDHVGVANVAEHRPIGDMGTMVFNRTLEQWKDVDLANRTDFDAYIASSLAAVGNQKRVLVKTDDKPIRRLPFQRYDNSGAFSKSI